MHIDSSKVAIIYLSSKENPAYIAKLEDLGYKHIIKQKTNENAQTLFQRAFTCNYDYFLSIDPSDGFKPDDLYAVTQAFLQAPQTLCVGMRQKKARESVVSAFFNFLSGLDANGIDSSLMAMNREVLALIAEMKSYDENFLFNAPLVVRANNIEVKYIETSVENQERLPAKTLARSFKLYLIFAKFGVASLATYAADIGSFVIFGILFGHLPNRYKILYATVLSRVLSSVVAYFLNKEAVFKTHGSDAGFILRFAILSVVQMVASWLLVLGLSTLMKTGNMGNLVAKIVVDFAIFMVSFTIQRDWVFKKTDGILK